MQTPLKVKFQDKRREEIDKTEQNIPKYLAHDRIAVEIRIKRQLYKGENRKRKGNRKKRRKNRKKIEREIVGVDTRLLF